MNAVAHRTFDGADATKTAQMVQSIDDEFHTAMDDNFNTYGVIVNAFKWFDFVSAELAKKHTEYDLGAIVAKIRAAFGVLNILQRNPAEYIDAARAKILAQNNITPDEIQSQIDARASAKAARDYAAADAIRAGLMSQGIALMDLPTGTTWDIVL